MIKNLPDEGANFMQILYWSSQEKNNPELISMYLKDNVENQTISELYTDDKKTKLMIRKQNILATLMIFLNQLKTFM